MHPLIKQLYNQSYIHEDGAKVWHDQVFDIEAFAQRLVFRCATTAKLAQSEGKDAYQEIIQKYGSEISSGEPHTQSLKVNHGPVPESGEYNELI